MKSSSQSLTNYLFWLVLCLIFTLATSFFIFDTSPFKSEADILIHDTYFIFPSWYILFTVFLLILLIIFSIVGFKTSYKSPLIIWTIISAGVLLIITLTLLAIKLPTFQSQGWTAYPPLSSLDKEQLIRQHKDKASESFLYIIYSFLGVILISLVFVVMKNKKAKPVISSAS